MTWSAAQIPDQSGRVAIVTGSNTGIGYEMAKALAKHNMHVIVASRSEAKGTAAVAKMKEELGDVKIEFMKVDLASSASIKAFVEAFLAKDLPLHILINNAGVAFVEQGKTEDGYETVVGVNHLGTFLLTTLLLDVLKKSAPARVVSVSSSGANSGKARLDDLKGEHIEKYDSMAVYCESKLYTVMFSQELEKRLEGTGVHSFVCHPGIAKTDIVGKAETGMFATSIAQKVQPMLAQKPESAAISALYCATSDEPLKTGTQYMYGPILIGNLFNTHASTVGSKDLNPENNAKLWEVTEKIVYPS